MRVLLPTPRLTVWLPALAILLFAVLYIPLAGKLLQTTVATQTVAASPKPKATQPTSVTSAAVITPTSSVPTPVSLTKCTPLAFGPASELMLNSTSTGLRIQNDSPTYYQIYGNTASDLHTQIAQCAPGANATSSAEYTGETNYNLTWQYSVAVTDTGCSLRNVQVGLHISTALPLWQPTSAVTTGLTDRWQQFIQALATHEHGHAQLDANYAGLLEQQLETLGNLDCNSVTDTIQSTVNTIVQALNNANNTYDQQTNHGAAQGAILPNY